MMNISNLKNDGMINFELIRKKINLKLSDYKLSKQKYRDEKRSKIQKEKEIKNTMQAQSFIQKVCSDIQNEVLKVT